MLYLLTGDVQIGKTRWLEGLVRQLDANGIMSFGVVAPGDWVPSNSPHANADGFEKRGIWNVLLPQGERIRFAWRRDLAPEGPSSGAREADAAGLGWRISDEALAQVNAHFANIGERCPTALDSSRVLLVVDELGRLELLHQGGLTEAVRLLERGPQGCMQDALVVARDVLAPLVEERFADRWGGCERIAPGASVLGCCGADEGRPSRS